MPQLMLLAKLKLGPSHSTAIIVGGRGPELATIEFRKPRKVGARADLVGTTMQHLSSPGNIVHCKSVVMA